MNDATLRFYSDASGTMARDRLHFTGYNVDRDDGEHFRAFNLVLKDKATGKTTISFWGVMDAERDGNMLICSTPYNWHGQPATLTVTVDDAKNGGVDSIDVKVTAADGSVLFDESAGAPQVSTTVIWYPSVP